jgi:hypothetical protein
MPGITINMSVKIEDWELYLQNGLKMRAIARSAFRAELERLKGLKKG